jgi:hypothetical protein
MAYCKAKLKSNGDRASPCFRPFLIGNAPDKCYGSVDKENKMPMAEAISCSNLINSMERKSFTTEQEIMQMYRLKEKLERH